MAILGIVFSSITLFLLLLGILFLAALFAI